MLRSLPARVLSLLLTALIGAAAALVFIADWREGLEPYRLRIEGPDYGPGKAPFLAAPPTTAPATPPDARLILVGDAGLPTTDTRLPDVGKTTSPAIFQAVSQWSDMFPAVTTTLFLGDNLYPDGFESNMHAYATEVLNNQIRAGGARSIFIPGNHDWGATGNGRGDIQRILRQQQFINEHSTAIFAPADGCPVPVRFNLLPATAAEQRALILIVFDSQWLFMPEQRPPCAGYGEYEVYRELEQLLALHREDIVVVAAHHPLASAASHGGYRRGFWRHLLEPLLARRGSLGTPSFRRFQHNMAAAMGENKPLIYASGHEHALQVFSGGNYAHYLLVSGSGAKTKAVTTLPNSVFAFGGQGFMVLDIYRERGLNLLHIVSADRKEPLATLELQPATD